MVNAGHPETRFTECPASSCSSCEFCWNRMIDCPSVAQTRIPVLAPSFGRGVQNGPERIQIGRTARILTGISGGKSHFAAPEMTDHSVAAREHVVARHVRVVPADVIARVVARNIRINPVPGPAARLLGAD